MQGLTPIENPNYVFPPGNIGYAYKTKSITKNVLNSIVKKDPTFGFNILDDTTSPAVRLFAKHNLQRSGGVEIVDDMLNPVSFPSSEIKPRVLAFDIETYTHDDSRFPDPLCVTDIVFLISCVCMDNENVVRKCCMVTPGDNFTFGSTMLDFDIDVTCVDTEYELIMWFLDLVDTFDPDIFTGYNLHYDVSYLETRALFSPELNFAIPRSGFASYVDSASYRYCVEVFGRIVVDMFEYMKSVRGSYGFERLSLNSVAKYFLNKSKTDMPYKKMFAMYRDHIESGNTEPPRTLIEYCVYDSELTMELFNSRDMWSYLIEFSNKYSATMRVVCQGTTTEKLNPFLYTTLHKMNYIFNTKPTREVYKISGGYVHLSAAGVHHSVGIADFASLYPSISIAYNVCWSTLVCADFRGDKWVFPIVYERDGVTIKDTLYFRKEPRGILPTILNDLIAERKTIKNKPDVDSQNKQLVIKTIANALCGFLGCRGRSRYVMALLNVAITQRGQMLIQRANNIIGLENHIYSDTDSSMMKLHVKELTLVTDIPVDRVGGGGSISDAETFVRQSLVHQYQTGVKKLLEIGKVLMQYNIVRNISKTVTDSLNRPLTFEFETLVRCGIFMKRKVYVAEKISLDNNLNVVKTLKLSGVCPRKTVYGKFIKQYYMAIVNAIMENCDTKEILIHYVSLLKSYMQDPLRSFDMFSIETKFKSYAVLSDRSAMKPFAERAIKLGVPFVNNSPVIYVMCSSKDDEAPRKYTKDMIMRTPHLVMAFDYYVEVMAKLYRQLTKYDTPKPSDRLRVEYDETLEY